MIRHIPNAITLLNLACGCLGITYCLQGDYPAVLMLMGAAMIADFADGLAARALNAKSELGLQLDSLADLVTFGVLPGTILYVLIGSALGTSTAEGSFLKLEHTGYIFTLFAALRLGKFNIDTRQTESFLGLATPAASLFVAGLLMIHHFDALPFSAFLDQPWLLVGIALMLSALMISEIPMFSFKVRSTLWKGNESRVLFLMGTFILILVLKWASLPAIIALYVLVSVVEGIVSKPD